MGDRDKRGLEVYRRREKRGWEAGEIGKDYAALCNIWREPGFKGMGSVRFIPLPPLLHNEGLVTPGGFDGPASLKTEIVSCNLQRLAT